MTETRKLRVFLCHSSQNKPIVRELYQRLNAEGWIDPWLDEEKLLPGQDWDMEIERAVEASDAVIACLSNNSVTKEGYIQRELKFVLDIALEKPEGTIFVVPLRLDDCTLPRRLRSWQYVDYFPAEQRKRAYQRLLQSLNVRHGQLTFNEDAGEKAESLERESSNGGIKEKAPPKIKVPDSLSVSPAFTPIGILDLGGSVLTIVYFVLAGLYALGLESSEMMTLWGISAILTGFFFLFKRQITPGAPLKISIILFLMTHAVVSYSEYTGVDLSSIPPIFEGLVAFIVTGLLVANLRSPRKPAPYSSILLSVFLFLVGAKLIINQFDSYPSDIYTYIIISGIVTSILLWLDQ